MKKIFIIILNFNGGDDILSCLDSLQLIKKPTSWKKEVIVVDNASTDRSVKKIESKYRKIKVFKNKKNLGFAGGNNIGIRYALRQDASAVLLLNQDTIVQPDFLEPLVNWIEYDKKAGIVGPIIKHAKFGRVQYDLGGEINWWFGRATHINKNKVDINKPVKRDYISGCCMLIKKETFQKTGLLDERFFLYFEDDDFCVRAKKKGFSTWVVPKSQIYHSLSTAAGFFSKTMVYYCTRNALFFGKKHLSPIKWPLALAWILISSLYFIAKKGDAGVAAFKGVKDFLLGKMGERKII